MLQEMAFDFTQTSYNNTHSVIPDLLHSLLLSPLSGLQPYWDQAFLDYSMHATIWGLLHSPFPS